MDSWDCPRPDFLALLDNAPENATEVFMVGGWKRLEARRLAGGLAILGWEPRDDPQAQIVDFLGQCCDQDFKLLRKYDSARFTSFLSWFLVTAWRHFHDQWKKRRAESDRRISVEALDHVAQAGNPAVEGVAPPLLLKLMAEISERCQVILSMKFWEGRSNEDIGVALGMGPSQGKRAGDAVAECMRALRSRIARAGYKREDLLAHEGF